MPFTAPVTRATDFLVTAAIWNAEHVDNFNTAVMHLMVRKTADESVVSSTVQQNDDVLFFAVAANEIWRFELMLITTGTFDFAGQMTFPSGRIDGSAIATVDSSAWERHLAREIKRAGCYEHQFKAPDLISGNREEQHVVILLHGG